MKYTYLLGSKMLKLNNTRDEDWLTFIDAPAKVAREQHCHSIPFYKAVIGAFIRATYVHEDIYNALHLYQLSASFFSDEVDYPFNDFNILEHKDSWIKWLKAYINDEKTERRANRTDILPKQFYNILYQYNMIIENVYFISDEAKVDVQKIHDLEMPASYFYELRDKINLL